MENYFTLWLSGMSVNSALSVRLVNETEKAMQFELLDNEKVTLWFPKAALKPEQSNPELLNIARWFNFNEFSNSVWKRYASYYRK